MSAAVHTAQRHLGGPALLFAFSLAAVGAGAGRALTTTYVPVLLERIQDSPTLIGVVMTVNAVAGFAVPIATGIWSDRRGRRVPFIAGGALLTLGGLIAVGLGNATSYLALGAAAALVYVGLNALTTAHRAIVAEDVEDGGRPAATSAQEIAGLAGAVVAVSIGGALIEPAPAAAFALAGVVLAITAVPTLLVSRRLGLGERARPALTRDERVPVREALRRPGAREILVAQVLWVFAYAALPSFFVLYAEDTLGLAVGAAGALPLGFGALTALGMVLAGRAKPERVRPLLLAGAALLGAGLLAAAPASSLPAAAPGFGAAAVGAGLLTALGFPYFARFVPEGEAGRYSGLFFAGRAVAAGAALPLAGLAVELTGSYRAVLWLGLAAALALVPLAAAERRGPATAGAGAEAFAVLRAWTPRLASLLLAAVALGLALPALQSVDNALFLAVNGLGDGPELLYQALDPHTRNYILLFGTALVAAGIVLRRPRHVLGTALAIVLAAYLAGAAIEVVKLFVERARPEEVLGAEAQLSHGRSWAHLASFPSGHLIVTAAMAAAASAAIPALRRPLMAYVVVIGITRVLFGAHFPLDVLAGAVLGYELGLFAARLTSAARLLPEPVLSRSAAVAGSPRPRSGLARAR